MCIAIFPSLSLKLNIKGQASDLFFEIQKNSWSRAPVKTVYLPVILGNLNPNGDILLKSIEILGKNKNLLLEEKVDTSLKKVYDFAKSADEVRKSLGINPPSIGDLDNAKKLFIEIDKTKDKIKKNILVEEAWQKLKYKPGDKSPDTYTEIEQKLSSLLYTKYIEIDLSKIKKDIEEEDYIPVTIRVNYEIGNTAYQAEEQTYIFYLNSLPTRTGWHPGDGHIHTQALSNQPDDPSNYTGNYENYGFSDATDSSTILSRRNQANSFGYKWIIITDHAGEDAVAPKRLESNEWLIYNTACTRAMSNYFPNITVCPGEELAMVEGTTSWTDPRSGHYLTYKNSSYVASYATACYELIQRSYNAGGFGVIAHPYNTFFHWGDWSATSQNGFTELEIISNQSDYSQNAINKWDELLTANLENIIYGGPKIIGMANSDVHNSTYMWGLNMNYIYTGSSNPPGTDRTAIYNNLKAGRVTASSDGSLAVFSLNGYAPGSVVNVNPGTNNVSITVSGKCISTAYPYIYVYIFSNNGTQVLYDSFYDLDTDFNKTYQLTATADCYYRVLVTFKDQSGAVKGYCLISPVYVNLP